MSPQMKKRIFEVEDKLIKKIDEGREKKVLSMSDWAIQMAQLEKQAIQARSHSVYYV